MNYEQKYKEAMLRADEAVQKGCLDKNIFDIIFPPEESEDERIRKWLIDYVGRETGFIDKFPSQGQVLAWLEKQKEQKPQGVYVDCTEHPEWYGMPPKEPKPAEWSEEDNKRMDAVIELLENTSAIHPNYSHRKLIIWLNDLRKQPKPDCDGCAKLLEGYINGRTDSENKLLEKYGIVETPEDELHMKARWKPSEEQMSALLAMLNDPNNIGSQTCQLALSELYDDLMKLKAL